MLFQWFLVDIYYVLLLFIIATFFLFFFSLFFVTSFGEFVAFVFYYYLDTQRVPCTCMTIINSIELITSRRIYTETNGTQKQYLYILYPSKPNGTK